MENTKDKRNWKERKKPSLDLGNMVYGKVPPQNKEVEEAVLGAIMVEKAAFDMVTEIITAESFYVEAHQRIFAAMMRLAQKNMPIDTLTVVQELIIKEELDIVGGPYYVNKLTNNVVSGANIETHARIMAESFIKREFIRVAGEMITMGYDDSIDAFDMQDSVDKSISEIISGNRQTTYSPITTAVAESIQRIEELRVQDSDLTGIDTGFPELNKITHGWQSTDLIILAARPSVGKTALAGNFARNAAKAFLNISRANKSLVKSVVLFSLEMSRRQLTDRLLSAESGIWLDKLSNGRLEDHEMSSLYHKGVERICELPLFIDDSAALNIFELRAKCRRLKNKYNLGMIIIDYLQLMSGLERNKQGNREQEISKISRDLKGLAKELKVPILALSQLSRETEKRKGEAKIPQLSDLRESGAIEQDADMVMFLYRPEYYEITANEMGESTKGETILKIAKHRSGSLGTIKLRALLHIQKFIEDNSFDEVKETMKERGFTSVSSVLNRNDDEVPF